MTGQVWDTPSEGLVVDGKVDNSNGSVPLRFNLESGVYGGATSLAKAWVLTNVSPIAFAPPEYAKAINDSGGFLLDDGTWSMPCDTKFNVSVLLGPAEITRWTWRRTD